ncbi:MAG: polysaccharide export protein [Bacteroidales bacterium]|nr:polysaccharide export protein [Bacteroidales bacterium]
MRNLIKIKVLTIGLLVAAAGCIPVKKMEYVKEAKDLDEHLYKATELKPNVIKMQDHVSVQVTALGESTNNFLSTGAAGTMVSEIALALSAYVVDLDGNIHLPIVGPVKVEGLTTEEATEKVREVLKGYLNQPVVRIKIVNKKVVVLGEVRIPGTYTYTKEYINVFDALSLAGDITDFGDRKNVYLIRHADDQIIKRKLNLRNPDFFTSDDFFVKENDIIYVKPLGAKRANLVYQPISIVLSIVSSALLIMSYIQNNNNSNAN